jgi:hypothetical protein
MGLRSIIRFRNNSMTAPIVIESAAAGSPPALAPAEGLELQRRIDPGAFVRSSERDNLWLLRRAAANGPSFLHLVAFRSLAGAAGRARN